MISIDRRAGSKDLYPQLRKMGLPVRLCTLEFGDLAFAGCGPLGTFQIGVEHKKLGDLVQSLMSRRLTGHQLPGMRRLYAHSWLLIEGLFKPDSDGSILEHRYGRWEPFGSRMTHAQLQGYLLSLELMTGLHIHHCSTRAETLEWLQTLYSWWQKPWEKHHAHLAIRAEHPQPSPSGQAVIDVSGVESDGPSLCRQMAMDLPGFDYVRSGEVDQTFGTVHRMVNASKEEWQLVKGVGPVLASRVYRALRGWPVKIKEGKK